MREARSEDIGTKIDTFVDVHDIFLLAAKFEL